MASRHHSASPDPRDIRVGGLCFDKDNNLWVTNSHNVTALSMKKPDGTWQAFNISELEESDFSQVIVDDYNQKWIVMRYGNTNPYSLLVFDDNNTTRKVRKLNSFALDSLTGSSGTEFFRRKRAYSREYGTEHCQ